MPTFRKQGAQLNSVLEATKGTDPGAKTYRHAFETLKITPNDLLYRPQLATGIFLANPGGEYAVHRGVDWSVGGPIVCDQFHAILGMAVQGVPVKTGASDPYTWTATRTATADPALKSRSFSYRMSDGTTPSDWKFLYAMAQKLEVQFAENAPLTFTLDGFARRLIADASFTAGLSLPVMDIPTMPQMTVYIDGSWTTPTAAIAATVLGGKLTIETGCMPIDTADVQANLDFTLDEINVGNVKTSCELLCLAKAGGTWATEKTAAEAGTLRQVTINATISANRSVQFRALMKHEAGSTFPDGDKDGLQTINLRFTGSTDATNFLEAIVKNSMATLT